MSENVFAFKISLILRGAIWLYLGAGAFFAVKAGGYLYACVFFLAALLVNVSFCFDHQGYYARFFGWRPKINYWGNQKIWLRKGRPSAGVIVTPRVTPSMGLINPLFLFSQYEKVCGALYYFAHSKANWDAKTKEYCAEMAKRYGFVDAPPP
jgi:hypothetical protein